MEKLNTKKDLIERLKDVLAVEINARDGYNQDVITFRNFEITGTIKKIKEDEDKHIKILNQLIDMLEE